MKLFIMQFPQASCYSLSLSASLLLSDFIRPALSNAINLCSSLNVRDQISTHTQPLIGLQPQFWKGHGRHSLSVVPVFTQS